MRAKVSRRPLTLTVHGAPQVTTAFSLSTASRMSGIPQRLLDIQPSFNISVEFDITTEEGHENNTD